MTRWILALAALTLLSTFAAAQRSTNPATRTIKPTGTVVSAARSVDFGAIARRLAFTPPPPPALGDQQPPTFGSTFFSSNSNGTSDASIAVGPNHVMVSALGVTTIRDRMGVNPVFIPTCTLFGYGIAFYMDFKYPGVYYLTDSDRFVVTCHYPVTKTFYVAVSQTGDPAGSWWTYSFPIAVVIHGLTFSPRVPSFGAGEDGLVFSAGLQFGSSTLWNGSAFLAVPIEPTLSGEKVTASLIIDPDTLNVRLGKTYGSSLGPIFGATRLDKDTIRFIGLENVATVPTLHTIDVDVAHGADVPATVESTNGTTFNTFGSQISHVVRAFDKVYLTYHNSSQNPFVGLRWAEYSLTDWPGSGAPTEVQYGDVVDTSFNLLMPSIAANKHGDVAVSFHRGNTSVKLDGAVVGRSATDPMGTISAATVYSSSPNLTYYLGFGQFFDIAIDPLDNERFWGAYSMLNISVAARESWVANWTITWTQSEAPWSFEWLEGTHISGDNNSLAWDADDYLVGRAVPTLSAIAPAIQLQVDAQIPEGEYFEVGLDVRAKVNTPGLSQRIELWDWVANDWADLGAQPATTTESLHSVTATGDPSRFVQAGSRAVRARISWSRTGRVIVWPWSASIDQVRWKVLMR